jgi:hypothetical protein
MNVVQTVRWIVFLALYTSVILPLYLTLRFHAPEWLFLYGPILAFWTVLIYAQVEGSQQAKVPETPQVLETHP